MIFISENGITRQATAEEELAIALHQEQARKDTVPIEVSLRQARLALFDNGEFGKVEAVLAGLPSPAKERAAIEWTTSQFIRRDSPLLQSLKPILGWDEDFLDLLFTEAAKIP